jgi:hypothetical protein
MACVNAPLPLLKGPVMKESNPLQYQEHVQSEIERARIARDDALAQLFIDVTEKLARVISPAENTQLKEGN